MRELLDGIVAVSERSALLEDEYIVIQTGLSQPNQRQVAIVSGGGSGHELAYTGFG